MQLDIFSIPERSLPEQSFELPRPIVKQDPKVEAAIAALLAIKKEVIAQFQVNTRIEAGDLHGEVVEVIDEILCMVQFDGESKPRPIFTETLSIEYSCNTDDMEVVE